jgi:hypothetical protein
MNKYFCYVCKEVDEECTITSFGITLCQSCKDDVENKVKSNNISVNLAIKLIKKDL